MPRLVVKELAPKRTAVKKTAAKNSASKKSGAGSDRRYGSVISKSVRGENGERFTVLSIDANSPTFGDDLSTVFARNVSKARKDNARRFGSPDRVPDKAR
ncbi:hypothetical protein [Rhodopseudomonas sp. AAP120]|uniref:hypothetical protein n=1 Tax=Rhodopseudomonas sp. AAP120 TaxID=1523430 RepID=UPI000A93FE55|nr:hypothetical protein [Rhodopseudomonas sp. AAP120]